MSRAIGRDDGRISYERRSRSRIVACWDGYDEFKFGGEKLKEEEYGRGEEAGGGGKRIESCEG